MRCGVAYHKPGGAGVSPVLWGKHPAFDLSVSVPELGSLLDHTGPLAEAEARAARNFGADHTFS
jgi:arginine decarboxylase